MDSDISENLDNSCDINISNSFVFKAKGPHDTPRPWVCKLCQFPFKFKGNLLEHMRFFHLKGKVPCNYCEKTFPTSNHLRKHMKEHAFQRNRCPHCGTKLDDINCTYDVHLNFCKRRPKVPLRSCEGMKVTATNGISSKRKKIINNNHIHSWQCIECNIQFMDKESFNKHECLSAASPSKSSKLDIASNISENIPTMDEILSVNLSNIESSNPISPESLSSVESSIQINTSNSSNDSSNTPKSDIIFSINSANEETHNHLNSDLSNSTDSSIHLNTSNCSKLANILSDNSKNSDEPIHPLSDISKLDSNNISNVNENISINPINCEKFSENSPKPSISTSISQSLTLVNTLAVNSTISNLSTTCSSSETSKLDSVKSDNVVNITSPVTIPSSLIAHSVSTRDLAKTSFSESSNHSSLEIKLCNSTNLNNSGTEKTTITKRYKETPSNTTNLCNEISVSSINTSNSSKFDNGLFTDELSNVKTNISLPNIASNFSGLNILPLNSTVSNLNTEMPNLSTTAYSRFDVDTITQDSSKVNTSTPITDTITSSSGYNSLLNINSVNSNWESLGLSMAGSFTSNSPRFMSSSTESPNSNILLNGIPNCSRVFDSSNTMNSNLNISNPGTNTVYNSSRFDNRSNDFSTSFVPTAGMTQPNLSLSPKSSSLLALANFCNQKQLNTKDSVYSSHLRTFTRAIDSVSHNKEILSRTTNFNIPSINHRNNSSIPNLYNNELNFAPPVFNSYMFPSSGIRMTPPVNFPQNVPNFFNPMLSPLRPPTQCFPYVRNSVENISCNPRNSIENISCNSINASFIPRLHPYQLNKTNSANIHCIECQYPFCLSQLKSREIPYRCPYCSMVFKKIECLNNHVASVHVTKTYQNINSPTIFNRNYNILCCEYCKNNFCDQKSLIAHIQQCPLKKCDNLEIKSTWVCNNCNKYFTSKLLLLDHSASCKISVMQIKPQAYIEKPQTASISSEQDKQENNERQNSFTNISHDKSVVSPLEHNLSKSQNMSCITCGHTIYGKGKLCVFCWLKFALSQDFKKLMNSDLTLAFTSQSILYKPISSKTFQSDIEVSTEIACCDKLKLKCYFCACHFSNIPSFEAHLDDCCKNKGSENIGVICCYCLNIFTEVSAYTDHAKNCKNYLANKLSSENTSNNIMRLNEKVDLQQSLPDKKIWECNKCNKVFTTIPLFNAHLPLCKIDKLNDIKNKVKRLNNNVDEQLLKFPAKVSSKTFPLSKCFEKKMSSVKLYCPRCGLCFDSKQKLKFHPCKQILKHMTSCSVHLEPLTGSKIMLMAQLLCKNGHSKRIGTQKKHCLSYRQRYNEIFSSSKILVNNSTNTQKNCEFSENLSKSNSNKKRIIDDENLLINVFSDYEKKFHKLTQFHTTIYSHKFVCICGQVRPYLQASIHMKIHKCSKNHQMKFLKPLWPSEFKKYNNLTCFSCKNCKNIFQNVEFFTGHLTFSYACRTFYRQMAKKRKKLKKPVKSKIIHKPNNVNICHNSFSEICTSKHNEQSEEKIYQLSDKSSVETCKMVVHNNIVKKESSLNEPIPSLSSIEFADKIAKCIKEMSSRSIAQEKQKKQESLKSTLDSKNKIVKLSNCDGWMVEFDSATGDWRYNTVLKYICATCYKSLLSKTSLIDHLKKEHNIHGVIKLSVIKKQKSSDSVSNECKEKKDYSVNIEPIERSSWSPIITNTFSLSLSSFECQVLNNGKKNN
ncbi:uncharacterized protein LOC111630785 isoform X1 [Centruroides sculpturatus]|uniref:uncharacterized protein LOC111630785 isoform X1 n=1 Tax=Centruroides sculpturatus TaxID=218467 RepID=UPI000C6CE931|nr:uncharacterized protein LOC111630785 isoform X1 [Centruroides sculpturatus]XP_023230702.1 uncharacterized protein LOC111630785 isoform X1 [Centruroides sculpturatus]XP_023230703.1 uncharacterized protein LOC111630785 isoform X1 [Centruroides sculpturatus]XP_023230704.1 uncharacterized protein LOC111630785 isoform X1 [Centruroides sculpturatus]XP_023230706.1 uncharacterized protein LOC111630785 isoform X1 [Centruroides sculpturatus]